MGVCEKTDTNNEKYYLINLVYMKANILKLAAILLILAGSFSSCTGESENDINKHIIGKWELISHGGFYSQWKMLDVVPDGSYVEFLSEGNARNYDSSKNKFHYYRTYKIKDNFIIYDHEKTYEQGRFEYKYTFTEEKLEMTHHQGHTTDLDANHFLIYQRKK